MTRPEPRGTNPEPPDQGEDLQKELREFLAQAAVSLVLEGSSPPKLEDQPPAPSPVPRSGKRTRHAGRSTALPAFLLVAATALAVVRWWPEPVRLPEALLGHWTTTAPTFAGRELILESRSLGFRVDPAQPEQRFPVIARRITPRGDAQDVRIEYDTPEGRFTLVLSLSPDGIRLANRSEVLWIRHTVSSSP